MKTFEELGVGEEICRAVSELGFVGAMPVQEEVIPYLLGKMNDVIALAQTGTGKTAAFGIPLLQTIWDDLTHTNDGFYHTDSTDSTDSYDFKDDKKKSVESVKSVCKKKTQAIILSPTRELCLQITDDIRSFAKYLPGINIVPVYGGTSITVQMRELRHGAQIIVATPGRLIDLVERGAAKLDQVSNVILDEADEMLNMGFSESIDTILASVPKERNTLLFSATMSKEIEAIAKNYLHDYKEIVVGSRNEGAENVNHIYYLVHSKDKYLALKRIVDYYPHIFAIIFCRTKVECQDVADKLIKDGYNAEALHGDLIQQQRDITMQKFRNHVTQFLVATDVAARGLDVDDLTHVINYSMPGDVESYTHRSGRTGRAGKSGTSISIMHVKELPRKRDIERTIGKEFKEAEIPQPKEICTKQLYKVMDEILKTNVDEEEIAPFMTEINRHFEYIDKEDLIKMIVSREFGRFLEYYANAPKIERPALRTPLRGAKKDGSGTSKDGRKGRAKGSLPLREGRGGAFVRLFINLGKHQGFYPGEVMQLLNRHIEGRQEVGHIDLHDNNCYIEVPTRDAGKVMNALNGRHYRNIEIRCNEDRKDKSKSRNSEIPVPQKPKASGKKSRSKRQQPDDANETDWRQFFKPQPSGKKQRELKGEEPDFSEEGWARRKPKKNK